MLFMIMLRELYKERETCGERKRCEQILVYILSNQMSGVWETDWRATHRMLRGMPEGFAVHYGGEVLSLWEAVGGGRAGILHGLP